ncbi:hypothetical protein ACEUZ9_002191 [Paracoccus litorisediminis]|uniref:hypothetical protein n=1 Tax=Paracoccus litorisediminis TaxID=2006130 RepID=UPI00372DC5F6
MSFQFPLTAELIERRAESMVAEATAMRTIAAALSELEALTGESLFVGKLVATDLPHFDIRVDVGLHDTVPPTESHLTEINRIMMGAPARELHTGGLVSNKVPSDPAPETIREAVNESRPVVPSTPAAEKPKGQSAARTASRTATAEPHRHSLWFGMLAPERRLVEHLDGLPDDFAPEDDLHLVEMLTSGSKVEAVAEFLQVDADTAMKRWRKLLSEDVVGTNGRPTIDGQKYLLAALRYRVEAAKAEAGDA